MYFPVHLKVHPRRGTRVYEAAIVPENLTGPPAFFLTLKIPLKNSSTKNNRKQYTVLNRRLKCAGNKNNDQVRSLAWIVGQKDSAQVAKKTVNRRHAIYQNDFTLSDKKTVEKDFAGFKIDGWVNRLEVRWVEWCCDLWMTWMMISKPLGCLHVVRGGLSS